VQRRRRSRPGRFPRGRSAASARVSWPVRARPAQASKRGITDCPRQAMPAALSRTPAAQSLRSVQCSRADSRVPAFPRAACRHRPRRITPTPYSDGGCGAPERGIWTSADIAVRLPIQSNSCAGLELFLPEQRCDAFEIAGCTFLVLYLRTSSHPMAWRRDELFSYFKNFVLMGPLPASDWVHAGEEERGAALASALVRAGARPGVRQATAGLSAVLPRCRDGSVNGQSGPRRDA